ncbi:hypothetical protein ZOD2009_13836 [Haladaptatus paucihalophilus DX253]|uniref:Uncharacterized protein n=1 Tax=Haladaptatus paucihalophilus DX253 TaxID=797209 RepID=E7QVD1_HALPU|nr:MULTISPECIES: hypothetical protein [Haladaptatus]EFW91453.1 hypothetical protein ZOD2009_13836 [Haladaptatus paucihalophilus DX253]GKZ15472.1 hypothetical protein HAL_33530 [Haladaptatus sp. T7]SHL32287.1 hypothetical protein SAMN05444342_3521 [Haladaptatus paucihalophilus DX253]
MHAGLIVAKIIVIILGVLIALQSYRAYRRYDNQPMLFLAIGFVMISIGAVIEGILFDIANVSIFYSGMIQSIIVIVGMGFVLYSLYYQPT